jgi:hypothetical protein
MSSAFAIAAVTAVLKDLLNNGLIDHDLSALGNVMVTALPPDRIATTNADEHSQLNLFLYQVSPNSGWRNAGLPSRDANGGRLTNPPLALDLHYLLTAYGKEEFHAEVLLGYAMQLLHETPVLTRAAINKTLKPALPAGVTLPTGIQMLSTSDLADQVELIKICPQFLNTEELSKLWAAIQAHYRPTAAYHLSVVLIEAGKPTKNPLPVLKRGKEDRGPAAQADLIPPFPTIEAITLPKNQISALLGDTLTIAGHHFAGESGDPAQVTLILRLATTRLPQPLDITVPAIKRSDKRIEQLIPDQPGVYYPAGFYRLSILVMPNGKPDETRTTNELPLLLAPQITAIGGQALPLPPQPPLSLTRTNIQGDLGDVTVNLTCDPEVLPDQPVALALGDREIPAEAHPVRTGALSFIVKRIRAGDYRLRLRVDGVESLLINRSDKQQAKFDDSQQVTIT